MIEQITKSTTPELPYLHSLGFETVEDYYYDSLRHSVVMKKDSTCVIVDYDLCLQNNDAVFDYSKYCEMQNGLMASFGRLFVATGCNRTPDRHSRENRPLKKGIQTGGK